MGFSSTLYVNNAWLNTIKSTGTSFNVAAGIGVVLHTGNPGGGSTNLSANTARGVVTFNTSTLSVLNSSTSPSWTSWPAGANNETINHISVWDSTTAGAGNALWTASLTTAKTVNTGDTFTLTSCSLAITTAV
jgi:hypothetical protein